MVKVEAGAAFFNTLGYGGSFVGELYLVELMGGSKLRDLMSRKSEKRPAAIHIPLSFLALFELPRDGLRD
jgi:hypothetical protein